MEVRPLERMFSKVTGDYDRLNRILTWGMDDRWRRLAAQQCLREPVRRVMDLCTGTGDLALAMARLAGKNVEIFGVDFSEKMLETARRKASGMAENIKLSFIRADAAQLPFESGTFDAVGIAFGFRNLTFENPHCGQHLSELSRVVAPHGRLVIVETSQPRSKWLRLGYHAYLRCLVGPLGGALSRQRGAYRYLARSACGFYHPEQISKMLDQVGFKIDFYKPLAAGAAGIHVACRCSL